MHKYLFTAILLVLINSCKKAEKMTFKTEKLGNVSFKIPSSFPLVKAKSIDTEVYDIVSDKKIIGSIYRGMYYQPFVENYSLTAEKEIYDKVRSQETRIFYSRNFEQDYKNGIYNDNYYYYDTIHKNIAQVMLPKKGNKGLIGIYFDSIDIHKNKLAIISNDLSENNKKTFLEIFKTIEVK
ncbi:MAG: hypothetical protein LBE92_17975 [Chryseobacterium sp.]|jgi:hypothetical protein|uniref:hypothetical protein n=1 Tax=Chryseobacterium sp. TaxID=1871047 RepID=UPI00283A3B64|nr:hypothetical protein [Chryseobacterium sp.]MDR2238014.1 hypothetical protein [Chryseobacterium sp.]